MGLRPIEPIGTEGDDHQPAIGSQESVVACPDLRRRTQHAVIDDHVYLASQPIKQGPTGRRGHVQSNRTLPGVQMDVSTARLKVRAAIDERTGGPHDRRPRPGLDLDDVRTEQRQQVTAISPGQAGIQLEHPHTLERRTNRTAPIEVGSVP